MAALDCVEVYEMVDARRQCETSPYGTKITTHCLYPSASPVCVHIASSGDQFRVSDGGGAAQASLRHGRDEWAVSAGLKAAKDRFSLHVEQGELFAIAKSAEWLPNVVVAVANGAAFAAASAVEHALQKQQKSLKERIGERLQEAVPNPDRNLAKDYSFRGRSGKLWELDFAIVTDKPILIKAVTPHHNSIAATYTTLSDVMDSDNRRLSVFSNRPKEEDAALLRQVAELVPFKGLVGSIPKFHL